MNWKQLQGKTVDGEFRLIEHLGGAEESATFAATAPGGSKAAINLVRANGSAGELLARWKVAQDVSHPNLLRALRCGRCELNGNDFTFIAMEYAEENLSQVLPERALTPNEVREMLPAILDALDSLHANGLVHGHLKPSNIMAAADQLKLSTDSLFHAGEPLRTQSPYNAPEVAAGVVPASDLWSLGVTLTEVLTQRRPTWEPGSTLAQLPDNMPDQFRVIVQRCLIPDPGLRGTTADIRERLKPVPVITGPTSVPTAARAKPKRAPVLVIVPAVAAVAIGAFIAIPHKTENPASSEQPAATTQDPQAPPPVPSRPKAVLTEATDLRPAPASEKAEPEKPSKIEVLVPAKASANIPVAAPPKPHTEPVRRNVNGTDGVVHQVMPDVPQRAMRTITGKVRVQVKVHVNREGDVVSSEFVSRGPSSYFANLTMQAAKQWKFAPADASNRAWNLQFEFRRSGISTNPTKID